jgi:hypothetical protein
MPIASETVTLSGSGLVFNNTYGSGVNATFHTTILAAENFLQSHFANAVTLNVSFDAQPLPLSVAGENSFSSSAVHHVSYAVLSSALRTHATSADDVAAVAALPAADPTQGQGFTVPVGMARILGLAGPGNGGIDDSITLNSSLSFTYGADALGVIEHEVTEGGMGRIGGLGIPSGTWGPMDLFRFTASGQRDYTGGRDGQSTFFSIDGQQILTQFKYHNAVSTSGRFDGFDFADWDNTRGDAFGPGGPGSPSLMSATDLRVMDILGWTPTGSGPPPASTDDFANSLADASHPFGQIAVGGSASGNLELAGDRDWFRIQLSAGTNYLITLQGLHGGGGTLEDPYLRLHDASGALLAQNDDIVDRVNRDSQLSFTAPTGGTYYVEAGAFNDSYSGTYKASLAATVTADDFANGLADSSHPLGQIAVNASISGSLESAGDRDWFRIQLSAGATYAINLQGQHAGGGTLEDPFLRLHDATGLLVAQNDDIVDGINRDSQLSFTAPAGGTYYLEAGAFDDSYTGSYRLSVAASASPDDFASSFTDTSHPFGQVSVNGTSSGTLEVAGDRDWFAVQLNAGTSYSAALKGVQGGGGTLGDPFLRLHDASGALLAQNNDADATIRDSLLSFTAPTSGTYYLEAGAFNDLSTGIYTVSLVAAPAVATITVPGRAPELAFDAAFYLAKNPDVAAAGMDAQLHYDGFGWKEGRNPDALFDTSYYLAHNADVARAGIDPLLHFETMGWREGRDPGPGFSLSSYLQHNPDVALAGINPLDHYLLYGSAEHRSL